MKNLILILVSTLFLNVAFASDGLKDEYSSGMSHNVFFNTDEHSLTSEEFQKLLKFIKATAHIDIKRMSIIGFCDDRGSVAYNQELSEKRANAIRHIISKYRNSDVKPKVLRVKGKGEIPLSTAEKAMFNDLRALNRKVAIVIAPKKLIADSFYEEDLKKGDLIILKSLKFKMGLRHLTPESVDSLKELADFLVKRKDIYFTINGHVCCTENGKESRDRQTGKLNLSEVRAKYIRDYLVKKGVDAKRVRYQGLKGRYNLGGDSKEDRRVELLVRYIAK